MFTNLPFRDHHATLTITFAIAETRNNIHGLPFFQTQCKIFHTEHSSLILKNYLITSTPLRRISFLQISHKRPPFTSKSFNLTVIKHNNIHGH